MLLFMEDKAHDKNLDKQPLESKHDDDETLHIKLKSRTRMETVVLTNTI